MIITEEESDDGCGVVTTLRIVGCKDEDAGKYTLLVKNSAGEARADSLLDVAGKPRPPKVVKEIEPKEMTVKGKKELRLQCKITGMPMPAIKWYRDGNEIKVSERVGLKWMMHLWGTQTRVANPSERKYVPSSVIKCLKWGFYYKKTFDKMSFTQKWSIFSCFDAFLFTKKNAPCFKKSHFFLFVIKNARLATLTDTPICIGRGRGSPVTRTGQARRDASFPFSSRNRKSNNEEKRRNASLGCRIRKKRKVFIFRSEIETCIKIVHGVT